VQVPLPRLGPGSRPCSYRIVLTVDLAIALMPNFLSSPRIPPSPYPLHGFGGLKEPPMPAEGVAPGAGPCFRGLFGILSELAMSVNHSGTSTFSTFPDRFGWRSNRFKSPLLCQPSYASKSPNCTMVGREERADAPLGQHVNGLDDLQGGGVIRLYMPRGATRAGCALCRRMKPYDAT